MNLKEIRTSKNLTQEQAAKILQVSRRSYINYEQGKINVDSIKYSYIKNALENYGNIDESHGIVSFDTIKKICSETMKDFDVEFCYLFGSYAKGTAKETSDIDLFVAMPLNAEKYFELVELLREKLHKKIDLIHETQLNNNLEFTKEIMRYGIRIFEQKD